MNDPLGTFDWSTLYALYDKLCRRFDQDDESLRALDTKPTTDRELYYVLVSRIATEMRNGGAVSLESYEAMLYWKLYSQPAALAKTCHCLKEELRLSTRKSLETLSLALPVEMAKDSSDIIRLLRDRFPVHGMKDPTALPVRTTFLHFLYPNLVPIVDKMVLEAVGVQNPNRASHDIGVVREYIPFAWELAERHFEKLTHIRNETPIRLIDMALWVNRGGCKGNPCRA